ncbi:MAG: hypothetical protein ACYCVD_09445 [Desulfitobacteriaceae bacterium]
MKTYKWTIICMFFLSLVSFCIAYYFAFLTPQDNSYGFWANLWIGVFVSSILVGINSLVAYFSERMKQLRKILDLIDEYKDEFYKISLCQGKDIEIQYQAIFELRDKLKQNQFLHELEDCEFFFPIFGIRSSILATRNFILQNNSFIQSITEHKNPYENTSIEEKSLCIDKFVNCYYSHTQNGPNISYSWNFSNECVKIAQPLFKIRYKENCIASYYKSKSLNKFNKFLKC